jgi:hypothetical protein
MKLPLPIEEAVRLASLWIKKYTDDWSIVKHEVMGELDNEHRMLFGRRDRITKKIPALNEVEKQIVTMWKELTGVQLVIRPIEERRAAKWWDPEEAEKNKKRMGRPPSKRKNVGW